MRKSTLVAFGFCSLLMTSVTMAKEPAASSSQAETLMCERGKQLLNDSFATGVSKPWRAAKGKWEAVDGATQGSELTEDMHGAVIRANLKQRNVVVQYSFKLEGAKTTTLSINDAKGHNSRVIVNAQGFTLRKDDHDHAGPDKAATLQTVKTAIAPNEWHTLVVELNGPEFLARLDGKQVGYGSHEAIDVDKTNFGLTVSGESVSFKDFGVWEATPKSDWASTKKKVVAESGK
ncbi:hypothetical protein LOC68_08810 [Blastopirellula sp. JC732]|uniref:3-keto-disaccharide hydrolase domain-containing protein n=1 Tax=Blastopirellula sediminis TaxID=2894196 RepID=A0A9X1MKQ5_9BACT|nr:hypothetical protein [Blastopirellula sediminis]MCC9608729.1 hypothetical protein [Blastopirellula sediminis]MCC9628494.1 hypothetical protein [Blastopirellula sediminis]